MKSEASDQHKQQEGRNQALENEVIEMRKQQQRNDELVIQLQSDLEQITHQLKSAKSQEQKESQMRLESEKLMASLQANQRMQELRLKKYGDQVQELSAEASGLRKEKERLVNEHA